MTNPSDLSAAILARLDEWQAVADAATAGPWDRSGYCMSDFSYHIGTPGPAGCTGIAIDDDHSMQEVVADAWRIADGRGEANATFIALARSALPATIRALREEVEWLGDDDKCGTYYAPDRLRVIARALGVEP